MLWFVGTLICTLSLSLALIVFCFPGLTRARVVVLHQVALRKNGISEQFSFHPWWQPLGVSVAGMLLLNFPSFCKFDVQAVIFVPCLHLFLNFPSSRQVVSSPADPYSVAIYPGIIKCSQSRWSPGKRCCRAVEEKRKQCHRDRWGFDLYFCSALIKAPGICFTQLHCHRHTWLQLSSVKNALVDASIISLIPDLWIATNISYIMLCL